MRLTRTPTTHLSDRASVIFATCTAIIGTVSMFVGLWLAIKHG